MGYLNSEHIRRFVQGETIAELTDDPLASDCFRLRFKSGHSLRLFAHKRGCECCKVEIIATPYRPDGEVKQSTEIEREDKQ